MDKLQAALQRARSFRDQDVPGTDAATLAPKAGSNKSADTLDARWNALTPLEVNDNSLLKHRIVTRSARKSATPFDILRTKVLLSMRQNYWKRLAITSPMPKSGKTTIACNLALGLARQSDLRSILFDLDIREPSLREFFDTDPRYGISEMLTGTASFEQQAMRFGDNVAISMAKFAESDPTRILMAEDTSERLDLIEATYEPDLMIFDLPSVLVNDDTRAFLKNASCALIVVRAETTTFGQFEACKREVEEHTNLLGVVMNAYRHDNSV